MSPSHSPQSTARRRPQSVALQILAACTLLGACLGVPLARFSQAPLFGTSAQLVLSQPAKPNDTSSPLSDETVQTQALLIKSTKVVQQAVERNKLFELASFRNVPPNDVPIQIVERMTTQVLPGSGKSNEATIEVLYSSTHADDAATTLNAVIRAFQDSLKGPMASADDELTQKLTKTRDELEVELKKQQVELRKFLREAPAGALTAANDPEHPMQRLRQFQEQRDAANRQRARLQALLKTAEAAQESRTSPAVIGRMLRSDELIGKPTMPISRGPSPAPSPPTPTAGADLKIDDEKSLAELFVRLRVELQAATSTLAELDETVRRAQSESKYLRDFQIQRRLLEDDIKNNESLRQALVEPLEKVGGESSQKMTAEVIVPPTEAREMSLGRPAAEIGTGAVLGFLIGLIGVVFYFAFGPAA